MIAGVRHTKVMESDFFNSLVSRVEALIDRAVDANAFLGLVYMLIVLPIFLLLMIGTIIITTPGLLIHYSAWSRSDIKRKDEIIKIFHDLSLISLAAVSIFVLAVYALPFPPDLPDQPCSTHPYC